jgi:hypothetical protein
MLEIIAVWAPLAIFQAFAIDARWPHVRHALRRAVLAALLFVEFFAVQYSRGASRGGASGYGPAAGGAYDPVGYVDWLAWAAWETERAWVLLAVVACVGALASTSAKALAGKLSGRDWGHDLKDDALLVAAVFFLVAAGGFWALVAG